MYSTADYGISFHSNASNTTQAFNHFPHYHNKEAYTDASPPSPGDCISLTAFSDACWGGQVGNSIPDGTPLELFKLRSMSGYLICRTGGPLAWKSIRQDQIAQSSCEAEIIATNECTTDLASLRLRAQDLGMTNAFTRATIYNDNQQQWTGLFRAQTKDPSTSTFAKILCGSITNAASPKNSHSWRHQRQQPIHQQRTEGRRPLPTLPRFLHGLQSNV
jgi:hypothetical protein